MDPDNDQWEQRVFNALVHAGGLKPFNGEGLHDQQEGHVDRTLGITTHNLFFGCNGSTVFGVLPSHIFSNGHMFFAQVGWDFTLFENTHQHSSRHTPNVHDTAANYLNCL